VPRRRLEHALAIDDEGVTGVPRIIGDELPVEQLGVDRRRRIQVSAGAASPFTATTKCGKLR